MRRPIILIAGLLGALGIVGAFEVDRLLGDPDVFFLRDEGGAQWIRLDVPFSLQLYPAADTGAQFETSFKTSQTFNYASLTVRAFRRCAVTLDGSPIYTSPPDLATWQEARDVPIPGPFPAGRHRLQIAVFNHNALPCVLAYSDKLGVRSGPDWDAVEPDGKRSRAIAASQATIPEASRPYPGVNDAFQRVWPWVAAVFVVAFAWTAWNGRARDRAPNWPRWHIQPRQLRWGLIAAWILLAANNLRQLPWRLGFDMDKHLEYVEYIVRHRSLPLANEGWEMFQPPLFYLLEAPWYALLSPRFGTDVLVRALRFVPLLCGLAQIEIVYRAGRAVFPEKEDLQTVATIVGGLLPAHIYVSQVIGNEPLAGVLTALTVLLCLLLLVEPARTRTAWFFAAMGVVWGLAVLSKVTPLLLAPLVVGAIAAHCRMSGASFRPAFLRTGIVLGAFSLTAGWYFVRNWASLGRAFVGNWDPVTGVAWWQEPSYRTWSQLTSFGTSLSHPVYGGVASLWDGLYSSLWLDGFVSGRILPPEKFPWNLDWLLAGAWLAAAPAAFLLSGLATCWRKEFDRSRNALLFASATIAIYVAAVIEFALHIPIYTAANARFLVGLLPCFAILAAAGAAPLLRFRMLRATVFAVITCWGFASYAAYFDATLLRRLLGHSL